VIGCVALGLQCELDCDRVGVGTEQVLSDSIPSTVAPRARDVDAVDIGLAHAPQVRGELLEVIRAVAEVLINQLKQWLVRDRWLLLVTGTDDDCWRCEQCRISAKFHPRSPRWRAVAPQRLALDELANPCAADQRDIQDSEAGLVVLEPDPRRRAPDSDKILFPA